VGRAAPWTILASSRCLAACKQAAKAHARLARQTTKGNRIRPYSRFRTLENRRWSQAAILVISLVILLFNTQ